MELVAMTMMKTVPLLKDMIDGQAVEHHVVPVNGHLRQDPQQGDFAPVTHNGQHLAKGLVALHPEAVHLLSPLVGGPLHGLVLPDDSGLVEGFVERPLLERWINGGFMLFEKQALELMADGEDVDLENDVLPKLANMQQLMICRHRGFWQSMNTMKDNLLLEELWQQGAPWKVW